MLVSTVRYFVFMLSGHYARRRPLSIPEDDFVCRVKYGQKKVSEIVDTQARCPYRPRMNITLTYDKLKESTTEQRAAYVARAEEIFMANLVHMRAKLAAVGMDLYKVAPGGDSWNMGKKEYRMAEALHKRYRASFVNAPELEKPGYGYNEYSRGKKPWLVIEKPDAEPKVRAEARSQANACFDSFLSKMAVKIAQPEIVSATLSGTIWDGCTVRITCMDGSAQVWTTKCILNQSVYGKLFNQWPTRRVD